MKYCSQCGGTVAQRIPDGDTQQRFVCGHCDVIHYQNPRIIAGCIPVYEDQVLLCRRAIEPRYGKWTLPAGFLENGESISQGALRETQEEANARVEIDTLYTIFSLPHISQVYVFYKGRAIAAAKSSILSSFRKSRVRESSHVERAKINLRERSRGRVSGRIARGLV